MTFRQSVKFLLWSREKRNSGDELTEAELDLYVDAYQTVVHFATEFLGIKPESWEYKNGRPFI